ncbi:MULTISPECIES: hypothetical protein [unclassified Streptomyces]|uniref:hypothetical protein n=1 Tax=unclassified Streptomyces TaxID=2593676 RepID=UPI0013A6BCCD|nr:MULTISPECIES: hypothetical protein [unclassified Streptomyces]QZZ25122.1 hypothetical protein A7X85_01350 [Streptomyces sp. ST1015]
MTSANSTARTGLRRKLGAVVGVVAAAATGMTLLAAPASAGPNCASGYHCVFYSSLTSARHSYFNSDANFTNDTFNQVSSGAGYGQNVNDNTASASNSSTGGYESHYYLHINNNSFLFCVNPGSYVQYLPSGQRNEASSLQLTGTTSTPCY